MSSPSREDLDAARQAAYDVASAAGHLVWAATSPAAVQVPAAVLRIADRLKTKATSRTPSPDALRAIQVGVAVRTLSGALKRGRGKIPAVLDVLLAGSAEPARLGNVVKATAHEVSWEWGRRLWCAVRDVLVVNHGHEDQGAGFDLPDELVRAAADDVVSRLRKYRGLDFAGLAELVRIEAARMVAARSEPGPGAERCRLAVQGDSVYLDGRPVWLNMVDDKQTEARTYLALLIKRRGLITSDRDAWTHAPELHGIRIRDLRGRLPEQITDLLETLRGRGTRLKESAWHTPRTYSTPRA